MTVDPTLLAITTVFGYVLLRFAAAVVTTDKRRRRHAGAGVGFASVAPVITGFSLGAGIAESDLPLFALGTIIWVTLALAFSAFAISRPRELRVS